MTYLLLRITTKNKRNDFKCKCIGQKLSQTLIELYSLIIHNLNDNTPKIKNWWAKIMMLKWTQIWDW